MHSANKPLLILAITVLLAMAFPVFAQGPEFVWLRWDDAITVQQDRLVINEVQEFDIANGPVRFGSRGWTTPVEISQVMVSINGGAPESLTPSNSDNPGTYTLAEAGDELVLRYNLPTPVDAGDTFAVQIDYAAPLDVEGVLDWIVIPGEHAFPIESSTIVIDFPEGEMPDASLVRVTSGNANIQQLEDRIVIQSTEPIPANQMFSIQAPFGAGIGQPGGSGNVPEVEPQPQPAPVDQAPSGGFDLGSILTLLCLFGVLIFFGGSSLLRGLLGGGSGGRIIPTGGSSPRPTGGLGRRPLDPTIGSGNRGFRRSTNQNRQIPSVRGKKDSGGSAGLG